MEKLGGKKWFQKRANELCFWLYSPHRKHVHSLQSPIIIIQESWTKHIFAFWIKWNPEVAKNEITKRKKVSDTRVYHTHTHTTQNWEHQLKSLFEWPFTKCSPFDVWTDAKGQMCVLVPVHWHGIDPCVVCCRLLFVLRSVRGSFIHPLLNKYDMTLLDMVCNAFGIWLNHRVQNRDLDTWHTLVIETILHCIRRIAKTENMNDAETLNATEKKNNKKKILFYSNSSKRNVQKYAWIGAKCVPSNERLAENVECRKWKSEYELMWMFIPATGKTMRMYLNSIKCFLFHSSFVLRTSTKATDKQRLSTTTYNTIPIQSNSNVGSKSSRVN